MKNITLSADEHLIHAARELAALEKTSLNKKFREWLLDYTSKKNRLKKFDLLMKQIEGKKLEGKIMTREERNER